MHLLLWPVPLYDCGWVTVNHSDLKQLPGLAVKIENVLDWSSLKLTEHELNWNEPAPNWTELVVYRMKWYSRNAKWGVKRMKCEYEQLRDSPHLTSPLLSLNPGSVYTKVEMYVWFQGYCCRIKYRYLTVWWCTVALGTEVRVGLPPKNAD